MIAYQLQNCASLSISYSHFVHKCWGFGKEVDANCIVHQHATSEQSICLRHSLSWNYRLNHSYSKMEFKECFLGLCKSKRMFHFYHCSSIYNGIVINGNNLTVRDNDLEGMKIQMNHLSHSKDVINALLRLLHEAARIFELSLKEKVPMLKNHWFSKSVFAHQNVPMLTISYQAAAYSILQVAFRASSHKAEKYGIVNVFVQQSLLNQSTLLENLIREHLSVTQPEVFVWFFSHQIPMVVANFINIFEANSWLAVSTTVCEQLSWMKSCDQNGLSVLMLTLICLAAVMKLESKFYSSEFISMIHHTIGRLGGMLLDFVPSSVAYCFMEDIDLHREFMTHLGSYAAESLLSGKHDIEVDSFLVCTIERQLCQAIDRERTWLRHVAPGSIEVFEKDLVVFGFFIALGRSTQRYMIENGIGFVSEPLESFIRYLVAGSTLYYSQLAFVSSYQLFVEVVCDQLEWLPFYQHGADTLKERTWKIEGSGNNVIISHVLDVCSCWMHVFTKYCKWLENPIHVHGRRFAYVAQKKLRKCMEQVVPSNELKAYLLQNASEDSESPVYSVPERVLLSLDKKVGADYDAGIEGHNKYLAQKRENILGKSLMSLKKASSNILRGSQLLAFDVMAAVWLSGRAVTGPELTNSEKRALRRTLMDLAAAIPIGILMLLPVTSIGHAAILALIQRYVPSLIPSTYSQHRLDLLMQLEKVKDMDVGEVE